MQVKGVREKQSLLRGLLSASRRRRLRFDHHHAPALPLLLRERQPRRREAVVTLMCVQRHLQRRGIMSALHGELLRSLRARGYRALTITWVANDNVKSLAAIAALGGHPYHHLTLYEAPIPSV